MKLVAVEASNVTLLNGAGSIAIISIISMLFLDEHPKTLIDGAPPSRRPEDHAPVVTVLRTGAI